MDTKKLNDALKEKTKIHILDFLMRGDKSYTEIMQELEEKDSGKVNYHLKSLLGLGLIQKDENYGLTLEGERFTMYAKQFQLKEQYPIPVVCCEVEREDGKILLAQRSKKPYKDYWLFPGGKVSQGETLFEAAQREVEEECGMSIAPTQISGSHPTIFKKDEQVAHHVILFHIKATLVEEKKHEFEKNSDVKAFKWFERDDIKNVNLVPSNKIFFKEGDVLEEQIIE